MIAHYPPLFQLPEPAWFHFDETIEFGDDGLFARATVPYLVPIKADFHLRPGPPPWDPSPAVVSASAGRPEPQSEPAVWRAAHGGYPVHWGKLVFAGVYLKTFTRMSTMEAANESGRHAVNAILDHWCSVKSSTSGPAPAGAESPAAGEGSPSEPAPRPHTVAEATRHMGSEVFYRASPAGDYCAIWDMEHEELPELAAASVPHGKTRRPRARGAPVASAPLGKTRRSRARDAPVPAFAVRS